MILHEERASVGQRMLWLIQRYRGGQGRLNYPLLLRLRGPLDARSLQRALDLLVVRHEALRTTFVRRRGLLTQLVHGPEPVPVTVVDLTPARLAEQRGADDRLAAGLRAETGTDIDATRSPLRVTLWRLDPHDHLLCVNAHHLVTDAWSARVLTDELLAALDGTALPRVQWQFRHYTGWQRRTSTMELMREDGDYWRRRLDQPSPPALGSVLSPALGSVAPPAGRVPSDPSNRRIRYDLGAGVSERIRQIARTARSTPFAVLLAAYYRTLYELGGTQDLSVAAPFANRGRPETAGTVGPFANLVILRTRLDPDADFTGLLRRTTATVNEATAHQGFPYYLLPARGGHDRPDRFDDLIMQMLPELPDSVTVGPLEVTVVPPEIESRFDLELNIVPHPSGLRLHLQYAPDRIAAEVARRLGDGYHATLVGLTAAAEPAGPDRDQPRL